MKIPAEKIKLLLAILSFVIPFSLFIATSSETLMFDDSAEFATVISLGSIAHPPGTPAYILSGMIWKTLTNLMGIPLVFSLTLFSGFCISLASTLLFLAFSKILFTINESSTPDEIIWVSFFTALAFSCGPTTWAWSNTIEVYGFQSLAYAITLYGLIHYNFNPVKRNLLIAAAGIAMGLSNHHVTMIFFLPFVPFFFMPQIFKSKKDATPLKKKKRSEGVPVFLTYFSVLRDKNFWTLAGVTALITVGFYGWLFYRAQQEYLFMFSKPDTLDTLIYHLRGGAYTKNITDTSSTIISARVPFFLKLTMIQLGVFVLFFLTGIITLIRSKRSPVLMIFLTYFLFLFIYQINNNQWASTDAYMLLPFMGLMFPTLFGLNEVFSKWKLKFVLPVLLSVTIVYHFNSHNRKTYPVGEELMQLLDQSAPKNSIVLISDWSTVMLYNYYRLVENFRPDLIVLNYDIKFTHYRILPLQYPEFYGKIEKEYNLFIDELRKVHPYQVTTTGCNLTTEKLMDVFTNLIHKIENVAHAEGRALMTDPRAHVFYREQKMYNPNRYVSGAYMSSVQGDTLSAELLLGMDFRFLSSPLLLHDAGALDKLVDFQAILDQHIAFYKANQFMDKLQRAEEAHRKVMRLQRKMKQSMSFAYKIK